MVASGPTTFDVAVIGFGPTGAMAALRCAQRGLAVVAIDASTEIYPLPRAIGMDAETVRLFHTAQLGDELGRWSTPLRGAEFVNADRERVVGIELPPGHIGPLGHPMTVMFEQPALEADLRRAAAKAGVEIRLGVEAVDLGGLDSDAATVVETTGGSIHARWVIGADGASSWMRRRLGVGIEDQGYDQEWLVVDTTVLDPELGLPSIVQQVCDPERITTYVIGHDRRRRWEFRLQPGETREDMLQPSNVRKLLDDWGRADQLRIDRTAVYRFHALIAERFRIGSVLLAGDAAHQMPPFNGQGMCSGLRDAENLAWKLGLINAGLAGDALLDSYQDERRPHAVATVEHTCDAGRLIDAIAAGDEISTEAGYGGGRSAPKLDSGVIESGHPAVGRPMPQPSVDGVGLDALLGQNFALVAEHDLEMPEPWVRLGATSVRVEPGVLSPKLIGDSDNTVVIVRPDRIVAAVTSDLESTTHRLLDGWAR